MPNIHYCTYKKSASYTAVAQDRIKISPRVKDKFDLAKFTY